ncbi:hypothetical protein GPJ56_001501 [Histomonas meleagridis]|uniref:uncharacterized protein n=1 Tax=Histomonas meleagridis TaxID=135588 RepID=UPI003559D1ED|nr:hypothetical protein GPJ56_001501 [Histomonas meleagridis]KAH0807007.1 hypothetical protein GO595_000183 [Histomonas meleagridis]
MEVNRFICFGKIAQGQSALHWEELFIVVQGYWLEFTKKIGQPCNFFIPLDITNISDACDETDSQSSLVLETSTQSGSYKIFIQTTNRFDIIQLYEFIIAGKELLAKAISDNLIQSTIKFQCVTTSHLFGLIGKNSVEIGESLSGIEIAKEDSKETIPFNCIKSLYASSHTNLCIDTLENDTLTTKEFICSNSTNLKNAIECFLYNYHKTYHTEQVPRPNE